MLASIENGDFCHTMIRHDVTLYAVRYREKGKPERWEWHTRDAYCLKALELLCDDLCRPLRIENRGGSWRAVASGQHGQADVTAVAESMEDACTKVLGQLDSFWRR